MSYTLVIIDMQPDFEAANYDWLVERIVEDVEQAKENRANILVVEYNDYGDTHEKIMEAIGDYLNAYTIEKWDDDGSEEIMDAIEDYKLFPELHICGINYSACVERTIRGLLMSEYPPNDIYVIVESCTNPEDWEEVLPSASLRTTYYLYNNYVNLV